MKKEGFTLLELLIVIIIVGILATLAISHYIPSKENTLDEQAEANLKLIYAQERIWKFENNVYAGPYTASTSNSDINNALKLHLPTTNSEWTYTILTCTYAGNSRFTAQAAGTPEGPSRNWCLNSNDPSVTSDPVPSGPNAGTTACTCP